MGLQGCWLQVLTLGFFNSVLLHRSCLSPPVVPKACFFCARFCILKLQPSSGPGTYKALLPSIASGFPCHPRTRKVFSFRKFPLYTLVFFQENCCHALTLDQSEPNNILKNTCFYLLGYIFPCEAPPAVCITLFRYRELHFTIRST